MKKILSFLVFLVFSVSLSAAAEDTEYYSYSYARLSYVNGDVFIQRAGDNGFEEGDVNLPVVKGDKIGTREGRAEIHFGKKNYLRIDRQTQLDLIELPVQGSDLIQLHMLSGDIFLRVNYLQREKDFEIHTPDASFYVLEEGLYRFVVRENVQTEVLVYSGGLEAAGQEGSVFVEENESLFAIDGAFRSDSIDYYTEYDDSFSDWSSSRDELQSRYVAKRYLPDELYEYETELAYNGRWTYESSYGYVWIPSVSYSTWRPYSHGRWVWYPIIGWTWVSSHSWGWATSRYGRWHWRNSLGWYWIPTRRWGPAWVHWHHGYDYLGWSPLSYWNRPVVIVNNRFYGRNNDRYYPTQSRALTVIRKDQIQARSISKVALSQDKVGRLGKISLSSKQPNLKSVVDKTSAKHVTASKVLSRTNLRQVNKSYSSGKAAGSISRVKSTSFRTSSSSLKNSGVIKRPSSRSSSTDKSTSSSGISTRAIKRFAPDSQKSVTSRSSATQGKGIVPSRFKSSAQSTTRSTPSRAADSKSVVKRFSSSSSQTPVRTKTTKKAPAPTEKKKDVNNIIRKFSSTSSSSASSRGRAATAPSRSSNSSSSAVRRPSSLSSTQRSTVRTPPKSSVSTRSIPSKRVTTPSRSSSSSRSTVSRSPQRSSPPRSTVSSPPRSSSSSRSTVRQPSRSSTSSKSTASRSSRSSSSSRSTVSRSSSSKRVKKK
ncbi:DUF6600 domain-containing protein [Acidobacteriota bacterium]